MKIDPHLKEEPQVNLNRTFTGFHEPSGQVLILGLTSGVYAKILVFFTPLQN